MTEFKQIIEDIFPDILSFASKKSEITNDMKLLEIINLISPGTELRKGLDEMLNGQLGALIVLGTNIVVESVIKGGFKLDIELTPQRLFELSKMDGAIVLSNDLKKIVYANVHLMPDKTVSSTETGIRHRSAEQTAKQSNLPVLAISHRRKVISLFYKDQKYVLKDIGLLLTKANYSLRTLNNYRLQIDEALEELTYYELNNSSSMEDVIKIIQKIIYMYMHQASLERIIIELGEEGREIKQTLLENTSGIDATLKLLIMDYSKKEIDIKDFIDTLKRYDISELSDVKRIAIELGLEKGKSIDDTVRPKGYRILSQIPKLSKVTIENVIKQKKDLTSIFLASQEELSYQANITDAQAKLLKERLNKINEATMNKLYH